MVEFELVASLIILNFWTIHRFSITSELLTFVQFHIYITGFIMKPPKAEENRKKLSDSLNLPFIDVGVYGEICSCHSSLVTIEWAVVNCHWTIACTSSSEGAPTVLLGGEFQDLDRATRGQQIHFQFCSLENTYKYKKESCPPLIFRCPCFQSLSRIIFPGKF